MIRDCLTLCQYILQILFFYIILRLHQNQRPNNMSTRPVGVTKTNSTIFFDNNCNRPITILRGRSWKTGYQFFCCNEPLFCFLICVETGYEVYKPLRNMKINRARAKTRKDFVAFISRWSLQNDELSRIRVLNLYIKLLINDKQYRHSHELKSQQKRGVQ